MRSSSTHHPAPARRRRAAPLAAASLTLLALAVAGCGNGGTSPAASPAGSTASTASTAGPAASATLPQPSTTPAAGASGSPPPAATSVPAAGARPHAAAARCTVTGLRMRLGAGDAGAGNIYYPLRFTNTSGHPCVLDGFPGVSLIRGDGGVIGTPAARRGPQGAAVVLAPGRTAQADLHTLNKGVKGDACWRAPTFLMAYPPGSKESMTLATASPVVCGDTFDVTTVH